MVHSSALVLINATLDHSIWNVTGIAIELNAFVTTIEIVADLRVIAWVFVALVYIAALVEQHVKLEAVRTRNRFAQSSLIWHLSWSEIELVAKLD